jgi:hypothetical protein
VPSTGLASIDHPTVLPDLTLTPRQHLDVPHVDHGPGEAPEELLLAGGEPSDDRRRGRAGRRQQLLVGLQRPTARLDVGVVIVVEGVRRGRVEVVERRRVAGPRAPQGEERPVPPVQRRVRPVRPAEVVQPRRHELALHAPERVRPCNASAVVVTPCVVLCRCKNHEACIAGFLSPLFFLPESATRSVSSRPTAPNFCWSVVRLSKGLGRLLAAVMLAVVPSRRPRGTRHLGPPDCAHGEKGGTTRHVAVLD